MFDPDDSISAGCASLNHLTRTLTLYAYAGDRVAETIGVSSHNAEVG